MRHTVAVKFKVGLRLHYEAVRAVSFEKDHVFCGLQHFGFSDLHVLH